MRKLTWWAVVLGSLVACATICYCAPGWLGLVCRPAGYSSDRPAAMRRAASETIERYDRRYGHLPRYQWPEHAQSSYRMAQKMLSADDDAGPDN